MILKNKIKILHLEDLPSDSDLVNRMLSKGEISYEIHTVDNKKDFEAALKAFSPDVILSDHSLINFDSVQALEITKASGLNIPFILVTATVSEEFAVEIMKQGANDYILKDRLQRLPIAILNVIEKKQSETEKKQMEQRLAFDKNNLDALINNTSDLMWSVDRDFKLIISNKPLDDLLLLMTGKKVTKGSDILSFASSPEEAERFKKHYEKAFSGEKFSEIEYNHIPDESWNEISYCPIYEGNKIIGAACHARDITEIKKVENKLIRREKGLKESQAVVHLGNWELNFSTNIAVWSEEACRIYGIPIEEREHTYPEWLTYIHPDDMEYVMTTINEAQKNFSEIILSHRIILKNGATKYVYSKCRFEFDSQEKPIGLYGIVHDITERKIAEEEREKMITDIIQRGKNLEQFTYIISHNLRAPIATILGFSKVLKENITEQDRDRIQQFLFVAVERLDETVKDLTKILQTKSEVIENKELIHFSDLVNVIKSDIRHLILKEKVKIITDFSAIDSISSIRSYIHSIFYNFISNGIKYKQRLATPVIRIKSWVHGDKVRISFQDNGTGIDLEQHGNNLFGLYKRFHLNVEGKGLGLFMVKTQLDVLGGSITVNSELDKGTEFIIELPL
ncbi:MAG: PAS domain-containing protein [Bacteroidota bacterium]|nr:PAS domain-containing protein [Bacteroidota bacterium]